MTEEPPPDIDEAIRPIYACLREMAASRLRNERRNHTLRPTELVHEAYLRLKGSAHLEGKSQAHLMVMLVRAMRRVLVDHARRRLARKRGGGATRVDLDSIEAPGRDGTIDALILDDLLERLRGLDEHQADVVELRLIGGYTVDEIAGALGVSRRRVQGAYTVGSAWLRRELAQ